MSQTDSQACPFDDHPHFKDRSHEKGRRFILGTVDLGTTSFTFGGQTVPGRALAELLGLTQGEARP